MIRNTFRMIRYDMRPYWLSILLQWFVMTIVLVLILVGYRVDKGVYFELTQSVMGLPKGVYGLLGIPADAKTGNIIFYILFPFMYFNVWMIWKGCERVFEIVYLDEITGRVLSVCGQLYSRLQLCVGKWLTAILLFVVQYASVYISGMVIVRIGSYNEHQLATGINSLWLMMLMGMAVTIVMMTLTFIVAIIRKCTYVCEGWLIGVIFGTLVVGSLYRLRDGLKVLLDFLGVKNLEVFDKLQWMEDLVRFSPLSWLNPYLEREPGEVVKFGMICLLICGICFGLAYVLYRKREFYSKF